MDKNWMVLLQEKNQVTGMLATNQTTTRYGLMLSEEEAGLILAEKNRTLKEQKRVEFGEGITPKIIYAFCDSDFIDQNNYVETLIRLQEIFYLYKNEMLDEISDEELLHFMREQFDGVCFGDLDYLECTCLSNFSQAIRAGYEGHRRSQGCGEYGQFDDVQRWDYELYMEALRDLGWG